MATNLNIDPRLIERAKKLGKHRTKKEAVTEALRQYVQRQNQRKIFELFGTIDYDPGYDYKAQRRRR